MERTPKCKEAARILSFQEGPQSYTISDLLPVPRLGHRSFTGVCPWPIAGVTLQEAGPQRACSPCGCGLRTSYIPPWERKLLSSSRRKLPSSSSTHSFITVCRHCCCGERSDHDWLTSSAQHIPYQVTTSLKPLLALTATQQQQHSLCKRTFRRG